jgi:signal transduction histidine kinase
MNELRLPSNRHILIVDDNQAIHADFRKILCPPASGHADLAAAETALFGLPASPPEPAVFEVASAYQGREGLAQVERSLAQQKPFALVFMDVRMPPGWDGIETITHIWNIAPDTQIVLCTAYSDYSWDEMIVRLGVSDRLTILKKPFDNIEVLQLAHALTEKWRLGREAHLKLEEMQALVNARTQELESAHQRLQAEMAERERMGEALRQSQKMEALGRLAGSVAHDFNNWLTVIRGNANLLLAENNQPPEARMALQDINEAAQHATKLTAEILAFSRQSRFQPQTFDLNGVLSRLGQMLQQLVGDRIRLEIRPAGSPLVIQADPLMLERVLMNLAANARDAMPQGGRLLIEAAETEIGRPELRRHPEARAGRFACVSVADSGTGIPPEILPQIFDPFFTTKEPGRGTGLGLATVYGIIRQHHGWIEIENRPGQGATFRFLIPLPSAKN